MNYISNILKTGLLAAGLALAAVGASASELRLNMPSATRWGTTVLPAGNYLVTYSANSPQLTLSGNGKEVTVLVSSTADSSAPTSNIQIDAVDGVPKVTRFTSSSIGKTFVLAQPRGAHASIVAF